MFDNTITLNIDGADRVLTRINQDGYASQYRHRTDAMVADLRIRHTSRVNSATAVQTDRHNVELNVTTYVGSPKAKVERKFYFVLENPSDMSSADAEDTGLAIAAGFLTSSQLAKLVSWES